ncbi:hypothetical protein MTP99_013069 [Tenebrio molitor]|nr:hypothetical protein MTP99_013069 [Tenebrio molitor]
MESERLKVWRTKFIQNIREYRQEGRLIPSVYKRTYIKSAVELCGSILFLTELCQAVEAASETQSKQVTELRSKPQWFYR